MEVFAAPDTADFEAALFRLARETGKDFGVVVKRNARLLGVALAIYTQPWGGREGNFAALKSGALKYNGLEDRKVGEAAVLRDIGRVYSSVDRVYEQIKRQANNDQAARGFYSAVMNGKLERAQRILASFRIFDRGLPLRKFDAGAAHQRRRNGRGRVGSRYAEFVVLDQKKLATYRTKIVRRVGTAKGGWAGAANSLGGMAGLPQWVTRHKSGGHSEDHTASDDPFAVLHNDVPWIDAVLNANGAQAAVDITEQKMMAHIHHVCAANARKAGFEYHDSGQEQKVMDL